MRYKFVQPVYSFEEAAKWRLWGLGFLEPLTTIALVVVSVCPARGRLFWIVFAISFYLLLGQGVDVASARRTCPYHLSRFSRNFSTMGTTPNRFRMSSFDTWSNLVMPAVQRSIFVSITAIFLSASFVVGQHSSGVLYTASRIKRGSAKPFFMNDGIRAQELQQTLAAIRHETTMLIESKPQLTTRAPNLHFQHMLGKHQNHVAGRITATTATAQMPVYECERHYEKLPLLASREELQAIRTLLEDEQIDRTSNLHSTKFRKWSRPPTRMSIRFEKRSKTPDSASISIRTISRNAAQRPRPQAAVRLLRRQPLLRWLPLDNGTIREGGCTPHLPPVPTESESANGRGEHLAEDKEQNVDRLTTTPLFETLDHVSKMFETRRNTQSGKRSKRPGSVSTARRIRPISLPPDTRHKNDAWKKTRKCSSSLVNAEADHEAAVAGPTTTITGTTAIGRTARIRQPPTLRDGGHPIRTEKCSSRPDHTPPCAFCAGKHFFDGCHNCRAHKRCRYCNEDTHHPSLCRIPLVHYEYQKITQIKVTRAYKVWQQLRAPPARQARQTTQPKKKTRLASAPNAKPKKTIVTTTPTILAPQVTAIQAVQALEKLDYQRIPNTTGTRILSLFLQGGARVRYEVIPQASQLSWTDITDKFTKAFKSSIEIVNAKGELCEMEQGSLSIGEFANRVKDKVDFALDSSASQRENRSVLN
ncbi:unnamed protein product [Caenorhabditis auriculariae]|uniref:Uncharacterized protein n=1 Tax=Caenorhabditis auriculariae TaxID=2777116 RepID=A0A8S1HAM0_9PELO|nr:unnamed protein product [Caenorhabditis auriculariae]